MACQAYWIFISMSPILYMDDLGVNLKDFGLYQGAIAAVFSIGSLSSAYALKRFGTRNCFIVSSILVGVFFILTAAISILNVKDPVVITLVMLVQAISMVYPINILWPLALDAVKGARGRMGAMLVTMRLVVCAISIEIASYFYAGNFVSVGIAICITLLVSMITCYMLIKEYKVLEFYDVEE